MKSYVAFVARYPATGVGFYITVALGMITATGWFTIQYHTWGILLLIPTLAWVSFAGIGTLAGCLAHDAENLRRMLDAYGQQVCTIYAENVNKGQ